MKSPETPTQDSPKRKPPPLKFVARVAPVKEVTLHGTADLAFWRKQFAAERLTPVEVDGRAQLFISSTETRFWGILFRESLIGIQVTRDNSDSEQVTGLFLPQAWNSLRAFAWVERNVFGTPYDHGQVTVDPKSPARLAISAQGQPLITAAQATARQPVSTADESWQGPIFLPTRPGKPPQLFIAQLNGRTDHYDFIPGNDQFDLAADAANAAVRALIDSGFTPTRWHLRAVAEHAKSKTYRVLDWYGE